MNTYPHRPVKPQVPHQGKWLNKDLQSTALVSVEDFIRLVMDLDNRVNDNNRDDFNKLVQELIQTEEYIEAKSKYLDECSRLRVQKKKKKKENSTEREETKMVEGTQSNSQGVGESEKVYEAQLYDPFVALCNVIIQKMGFLSENDKLANDRRILFYKQDHYPIRGFTLTHRILDVGVLGEDGASLKAKHGENLAANMTWQDLAHWVEIKRLKGRTLTRRPGHVLPTDEAPASATDLREIFSRTSSPVDRMSSTSSRRSGKPESLPVTPRTSSSQKRHRDDTDLLTSSKRHKNTGSSSKAKLCDSFSLSVTNKDTAKLVRDLQLQNAGYALELLSSGILRSHAIGMAVDTEQVQLVFYDHSGILISAPFSIKDNESLFLSVMFHLRALTPLQRGSAPRRQLKLLKRQQLLRKRDPKGWPYIPIYQGAELEMGNQSLVLGENLYTARSIIGRSTLVIEAKADDGGEFIVKISFPVKSRTSESRLLWKVARVSKTNRKWKWVKNLLPKMWYWDDTLLSEEAGFPHERIKAFLDERLGDKSFYEERILRLICQERLYPITILREDFQYAKVFCDVLQGHRWLYDHAQILHRDISIQNVMVRFVGDTFYGVLNDLDMALEYLKQQGISSKDRTGTRPFMARDHLMTDVITQHRYRHDLESFFYVILCICCRYNLEGKVCKRTYDDWYTGTPEVVLKSKTWFFSISNTPFVPPVTEDFRHFAPVLVDLHDLFFKGEFQRWSSHFNNQPFDEQTLGGNVTYGNFLNCLQKFDDCILVEVYYPESEIVSLDSLEILPDPSDDFEESMGFWMDNDFDSGVSSEGEVV